LTEQREDAGADIVVTFASDIELALAIHGYACRTIESAGGAGAVYAADLECDATQGRGNTCG
jgi:hypothetical protein